MSRERKAIVLPDYREYSNEDPAPHGVLLHWSEGNFGHYAAVQPLRGLRAIDPTSINTAINRLPPAIDSDSHLPEFYRLIAQLPPAWGVPYRYFEPTAPNERVAARITEISRAFR